MTEQLHDLLSRLADDAVPGPDDPTLWSRARQARRRDRTLRAVVTAVALTALVGVAVVATNDSDTRPAPADRTPTPDRTTAPALLSVRALRGDGGLPLERDLAVGPASVVVGTGSGAFVVTAGDGRYHRLGLPGYDPSAYDSEHSGLALSPAGTHLAYGWRSADGTRAGTRVLDLRTGRVRRLPVGPPDVVGVVTLLRTYGYAWSPDGQLLVFQLEASSTADVEDSPFSLYAGIDLGDPGGRYEVAAASPPSRYFLWTGEARFASCGQACPPLAVFSSWRVARVDGSTIRVAQILDSGLGYTDGPVPVGDWTVGRFAADGDPLLLQPRGVGPGLVVVKDPGGHRQPHPEGRLLALPAGDWPDGATITLLGWVGPHRVLAALHRATGPDTWAAEGTFALLDVGPTGLRVEEVGVVGAGDPVTALEVATDLVTR
jgi:hypothetical protein